MKRNREVVLTALVAGAAMVLAACSTSDSMDYVDEQHGRGRLDDRRGQWERHRIGIGHRIGRAVQRRRIRERLRRPVLRRRSRRARSPRPTPGRRSSKAATSRWQSKSPHDYNNLTSTANNFSNSLTGSQTQPSPFYVDNNFKLYVDKDLMDSVVLQSDDPQVVVYKLKPEAVWSDGEPGRAATSTSPGSATLQGADPGRRRRRGARVRPGRYDRLRPDEGPGLLRRRQDRHHHLHLALRGLEGRLFRWCPRTSSRPTPASPTSPRSRPPTPAATPSSSAPPTSSSSPASTRRSTCRPGRSLVQSTRPSSPFSSATTVVGQPRPTESLTILTNADGQSEVQSLQNQEVQVISPQPDAGLASISCAMPGSPVQRVRRRDVRAHRLPHVGAALPG